MTFFEGFTESRVDVGDGVVLRIRTGGSGPPVVLLHGHPRTHTTWHRVAPRLVAAGHTVVCLDLRGYGRSSKPPTTDDHAPYSKRAMAGDDADRAAGRRVTCPTLVLWSGRDDLEDLFGDPRPILAAWTTDLRGDGVIDSGHHMAEDAPEELVRALVPFLAM